MNDNTRSSGGEEGGEITLFPSEIVTRLSPGEENEVREESYATITSEDGEASIEVSSYVNLGEITLSLFIEDHEDGYYNGAGICLTMSKAIQLSKVIDKFLLRPESLSK